MHLCTYAQGFLFCRRARVQTHATSSGGEQLVAIDPSWRKAYFVLHNDGKLFVYSDSVL